MNYIFVKDGKVNGCGQCTIVGGGFTNIEVSEEVYNNFSEDNLTYIYDGENIVPNPNYEDEKRARERQEKDLLTLTPADVERALLKAKGMDFDDLKVFLKTQGYTDLQIKAIGVELRANDFYRGAKANGVRLFDTIGALLGYSSDDMDYLFEHKQLPNRG